MICPKPHGALTGLSDDDNPPYHNDARGDAQYLQLTGGTLTGNLIMAAGTDVIIPDSPVNPTDAANKEHVDNLVVGLDLRQGTYVYGI